MPVQVSYPGVYIAETSSGVRSITGVPTSITAFVGRTSRGPVNEPVTVNSLEDFTRQLGGLGVDFPLSYAVRDFYTNGGNQAIIVRLAKNPATAKQNDLKLEAASPGEWGNTLGFVVDSQGITPEVAARLGIAREELFNLRLYENSGKDAVEQFLNVAVISTAGTRRLDRVLTTESKLARVQLKNDGTTDLPPARPADSTAQKNPAHPAGGDSTKQKKFSGGVNGDGLTADTDFLGDEKARTGIYALAKADLFNLLCIPPDTRGGDTPATVWQKAQTYCVKRRAILIVDPEAAWSAHPTTAVNNAATGLGSLGLTGVEARNSALYFPRIFAADPLRGGQLDAFVPCGAVAGVIARTDTQRGVWKAPAGLEATLRGVTGLQASLNDAENGQLNPLGINCLRSFPASGHVIWGARTLRGADQFSVDYKYVPVRRLALHIEESLYRGTQWAVFEPNDEPLWAQIRLSVATFMQNLFRQGAFQGKSPRDAHFVKCGKDSTTQNEIHLGRINIIVGFAPLKPAEFVIITLPQSAGPVKT